MWQAVSAGGEWRGEFHNRRQDGSLYWEAAVISALRDDKGEITHFLAVKADITDRKRLEAEVEVRKRELAKNQTLAEMGRMAAMLAHDLRNPLSSIKMSVQILAKQAVNAAAQELVGISQEQIRYMEDIITDMLAYSRPGELKLDWLDAKRLLDGVVATTQRRIQEYAVRVELDCAPGLPTFPGDASKLRQVIVNLLVNALQASTCRAPGERAVNISASLALEPYGTRLQIRVCDEGAGLGADDPEALFEPFYTTRAKGTGLGLAIARQISALHGGHIVLEPNQPRGTCAVLSLPVTPAARPPGRAAGESGA